MASSASPERVTTPPVCPTHLVTDSPSDTDAFGAHGRIAQAIAQLVISSSGGKSIGLLGTWGAGKSTVVEIMRRQLEADPRFTVWLFDAWAHEGDSLRRMFLERLTETLRNKQWLTGAEWTERLEYLAKRRKVVEQSNTPRLSPLAVLLAVSLLLVPIGLDLWGKRLDAGIGFDPARPVDWPAVIGVLGAIAPLLVLIGYVAWLVLRGTSIAALRGTLADALTLFVRQTDTASRTETLDSGEPTSLEFERVFCDAMDAALTPRQGTDRRLVLVVDNLDRVTAEQALSVWSTLQTFLRQREGREPWLDRLWCLLPFDGKAIRRLWPDDATHGSLAESFLDKTFQVRFEVPLPLLSDWKDYILARLKEAMPANHTEDEFFKVYRLYSVRRSGGAPTPRELKLFVNQVGSLHRQWQDEIPVPDLAYYVLLRRDGMDITADSLAQLPTPGEAGLVSDNVKQHLAAMAYGVSIASAQELLLREPIVRALEAGDTDALQSLSVSDVFSLVFEQALWIGCDEWPFAEGGKLLHAAAAIDDSGIATRETASRVDQWFTRIRAAIGKVGTWAPMDERAVDGILRLTARLPSLVGPLFNGFVGARATPAALNAPSAIPSFVADYIRLRKVMTASLPGGAVALPIDAATFARLALEVVARDPERDIWGEFTLPAVENALAEWSQPEYAFGEDALAAVRVLSVASPSIDWAPFVERAVVKMRETTGPEAFLVMALHALGDAGGADEAIRERVSSGVARGWAARFNAETPGDFSAGPWLYSVAAIEPELGQIVNQEESEGRDIGLLRRQLTVDLHLAQPLAVALARAVWYGGDATVLFTSASRQPQVRPFMLSAVLELAAMRPSTQVFPVRLLLEEWTLSFPGVDPNPVVMRLAESGYPIAQMLASTNSFWPDSGALYAAVLEARAEVPPAYIAFCVSWLQQLSAASWKGSLRGDVGLGRMVAALAQRGTKVSLGAPVVSAFETLSAEIAKSSSSSGDPWRKAALDALDPSARAGVFASILDHLPMDSQVDLVKLFALADPSVLELPWLPQHPDGFAIAAAYICAHLNDVWLSALARAVSAHPQALAMAGEVLRLRVAASFSERRSSSQNLEAEPALRELGTALSAAGVLRSGGVDGPSPA